MPDIIIEVQKSSNLKYEMDETVATGPILRLDRVLNTAMVYPGNYGYIPGTLAEDGDPLDALLMVPYQLLPGSIIECRPVGVVIMSDEKGLDEKIIMVPETSVDPSFENVQELEDLSETTRTIIEDFFSHYKNNEVDKWTKVNSFEGRSVAEELIIKYAKK